MVALMGVRTVIAGMRPSIAITATQFGLTLGNTLTALDVDRALDILGYTPLGENYDSETGTSQASND
jgi:rsbT antagonist protein RsbS